jgi:1-acyl-sn-glycerol-3-phosphate acyltransferase
MATAPPRRRRAETTDATMRSRLDTLLHAIDAELDRRRVDAQLEPAGGAPVDIAQLSSISGDLAGLVGHGIDGALRVAGLDRGDLSRAVRGGFDVLNRRAEHARAVREGATTADEFGFDREWTETWLPLFTWIYRSWWRVRSVGVENVPADSRALLVSNHAGVVPYDGAMIRTALYLEHPAKMHARALVLDGLMNMPFASWFIRRTGNTLANMRDAELLLRHEQPVLVFPEGAKGTGKPYGERYRLRRFGRGGFAEIAMRTGSPIIPISVVGSEEIHPMLGDIAPLAKLLGLPYLPVTPTFPLLGPLGLLPLPSSWIIEFHEPIPTAHYTARDAKDPATVLAVSDQVRDVIQQGVYRNLERRGSVFAG